MACATLPLLTKTEKAQAAEGCAFFLLSIFRIASWRGQNGHISEVYICMQFSNLRAKARVLALDRITGSSSAGQEPQTLPSSREAVIGITEPKFTPG